MYTGAKPRRHLSTRNAVLNFSLCRTGSQWSCRITGVMRSYFLSTSPGEQQHSGGTATCPAASHWRQYQSWSKWKKISLSICQLTQSPSQKEIFQYLQMCCSPNNFESTCCDSCLLYLTGQCNECAYNKCTTTNRWTMYNVQIQQNRCSYSILVASSLDVHPSIHPCIYDKSVVQASCYYWYCHFLMLHYRYYDKKIISILWIICFKN